MFIRWELLDSWLETLLEGKSLQMGYCPFCDEFTPAWLLDSGPEGILYRCTSCPRRSNFPHTGAVSSGPYVVGNALTVAQQKELSAKGLDTVEGQIEAIQFALERERRTAQSMAKKKAKEAAQEAKRLVACSTYLHQIKQM